MNQPNIPFWRLPEDRRSAREQGTMAAIQQATIARLSAQNEELRASQWAITSFGVLVALAVGLGLGYAVGRLL